MNLENFPQKLSSGDTFSFQFQHPLYGEGWTANMVAVGPTKINITSSFSENTFSLAATPAVTKSWLAGDYKMSIYMAQENERHTVLSRPLTILPNLETLTGDPRSHIQKVLDAINAVLEERATTDQENMSLNGRTLVRTPIGDLLKLKQFYMRELDREKRAQGLLENWGGGRPNKIRVRL